MSQKGPRRTRLRENFSLFPPLTFRFGGICDGTAIDARLRGIMASVRISSGDRTPAAELRAWVQDHLALEPARSAELLQRIDDVVARQRALV